jgi:hypothetical protein
MLFAAAKPSPMRKYLKEAFWLGPQVPGLGRLPVNALAALGFAILGLGHPGFWLLGAGLEAAYLSMVATHPRFQRAIDARERFLEAGSAEEGRRELAASLGPEARRRFDSLETKIASVLQTGREAHLGALEIESRRDALERLSWIALKLLVARHQLEASRLHAGEADLKRRIAGLEHELATESGEPSALRQSQSATLEILRQRLRNLERSEQTLKQIDSDLTRVEAQVDLAFESATLQGGGEIVAANLELATEALKDGFDFGDLEKAVVSVDQAYAAPPREREH